MVSSISVHCKCLKGVYNHIDGVMVSVLASSTVVRGFESRSGQAKAYIIGTCCFSVGRFSELAQYKFNSSTKRTSVSLSLLNGRLFSLKNRSLDAKQQPSTLIWYLYCIYIIYTLYIYGMIITKNTLKIPKG